VATAELQSALAQFVTFARSLKGGEKSEAQLFSDAPSQRLGRTTGLSSKMSPLE